MQQRIRSKKQYKNPPELKAIGSKGCPPCEPRTMMEKRPTPRYIIMKLQSSRDKEKILKPSMIRNTRSWKTVKNNGIKIPGKYQKK